MAFVIIIVAVDTALISGSNTQPLRTGVTSILTWRRAVLGHYVLPGQVDQVALWLPL
jgi:hypothetical protein